MRGKILILTAIMAICLSMTAFGLATDPYANAWSEPQNNIMGQGVVTGEIGNWGYDFGSYLTRDKATGNQMHTLVVDFDGDAVLEALTFSGSYIQFYTYQDNILSLEDEFAIPDTVNSSCSAIYNYDADDYEEFGCVFASNFTIYEYNGTALNTEYTSNFSAYALDSSAISGTRCAMEEFGYCFFLTRDHAKDWIRVIVLDVDAGTWYSHSHGNITAININKPFDKRHAPPVYDIDRDGLLETAMFIQTDGNSGDLYIIELLSGAEQGIAALDEQTGLRGNQFEYVMFYNIDGQGGTEVIVAHYTGPGGMVEIFDAFGNKKYSTYHFGTGTGYATPIGIISGDFYSDDYGDVCGIFNKYGTNNSVLRCISPEGAIEQTDLFTTTVFASGDYLFHNIIGADMDNNGKLDIVTPGGIIYLWGETNYTASTWEYTFSVDSLADSDQNGDLEIWGTNATGVGLRYSSAINDPPDLLGSYQADSMGPVCLNSYRTWTAYECPTYGECNFDNDGIYDREYIYTNCGSGGYQNGTDDYSAPQFSCYFNQTGAFTFNLYLKDMFNHDSEEEFESITISVINGTDAISCNIPCVGDACLPNATPVTPLPDPDPFSEQMVADMVDDFTFQNTFVKKFVAVIFILMTLGYLVYKGVQNMYAYAAALIITSICCAMLTLISYTISFYIIICMGALTVMAHVLGNTGET